MKRKLPVILLCLIFLGIAAFSGYKIITILSEYKAGEDAYQQLQELASLPAQSQDSEQPSEKPSQSEQTQQTDMEVTVSVAAPEQEEKPSVNFTVLHAINEDVVGWIYQEGTAVNYPVVQGVDNQEYLYWLINGDYNSAGTPFMDYRNEADFSDRNTVVYGHNMNNGTMFADVHKYTQQAYYDAHPTMLLLTPEGDYTVEFFAGYITDLNANAWQMDFSSDEEFEGWLNNAVSRSAFTSSVEPTAQDRVLTLSTCSDSAAKTRFVLLGVLR